MRSQRVAGRRHWRRWAAVAGTTWLAMASVAGAAKADFVQQGGKLVGSPAAGRSDTGISVAIADDGNTALLGAPGLGGGGYNSPGGAFVFTRTGYTWSQPGPALVGTGDTGQGATVALSADGNTALLGASQGAFAFARTATGWVQQGPELVGNGASSTTSVALSADGNTALIGESGLNNWTGAAYVFVRSGPSWSEQGPPLVGNCTSACSGPNGTGEAGSGLFGAGVSLSGDGNIALIGAPGDGGPFSNAIGPGAAWIFTRSGSTWTEQGAKLTAGQSGGADSGLGNGVALSRDGSTALLNAPADGSGAAWVFSQTASGWVQQTRLAGNAELYGNPAGEVALSDDGNLALLGGTQGGLVYRRSGSVWGPAQAGALIGTNAGGEAEQGSGVALAGDGSTALLGGPNDNNGLGAAWVFTSGPPPLVPLSVSLVGAGSGTISGSGINCPGTCTVSVAAGTAVNLLATPSPGSTFGGWSGGCSGTATCSLVVGQPTEVTASFVRPPQCTLRVPDDHVQLPSTRRGRARRAVGVLATAVQCDQAADVMLTGVITEPSHRRRARGTTRFSLGPLRAGVGSGVRQTLTLRLPRAALSGLSKRATESLALVLVASNGAGSSRTNAGAVQLSARR